MKRARDAARCKGPEFNTHTHKYILNYQTWETEGEGCKESQQQYVPNQKEPGQEKNPTNKRTEKDKGQVTIHKHLGGTKDL